MFSSTSFSLESKTFLNMVKSTLQGGRNEQGEHTPLINSSSNSGGGHITPKQSKKQETESSTKGSGKKTSEVSTALQSMLVQKKEPVDSSLVNALKENSLIIKLRNNPRKVNFYGFKLKLDIKGTDDEAVVPLKLAIEYELKNSLKKEKVDIQSIYADLGSSDFRKSVFEAPTITRLSGKLKSNEKSYDFFITIYFKEDKQQNGCYFTKREKSNLEKRYSIMNKEFLTLIKGLSTDVVSKQLQINEQDNDETTIFSDYKNLETIWVKLYNYETKPISHFLRGNK